LDVARVSLAAVDFAGSRAGHRADHLTVDEEQALASSALGRLGSAAWLSAWTSPWLPPGYEQNFWNAA
jgi:hypothetical protein